MRCAKVLSTSVAAIALTAYAALPARAADELLSGTIKAAGGAALGGVTVSAKPEGGTITTTVFTDESGNYYFPPLPAGKYRVWAQAVSFATAKGEVDLAANGSARLHARRDERSRAHLRAVAWQCRPLGAAGCDARRPAHEADRAHGVHRLS